MIDEVISHTADIHPWFKESRSSRDNPKADWYVWADAKPDGTPPNNWLSIFGGSAWQWDTRRQQYYLHNFLAEQPDLNFHNSEVQDALLDVTRFWLERGVDGFRLDTINFYFHSEGLEDNPPLPVEERNDQTAPAVNPYNYQDHIYDKSRPENLGFLERFRALLDEYPAAAAVGEVGDSQRGLEVVAAYTAGGNQSADVLRLRLPGAGEDQRRQGALRARSLRPRRQRRLVLLGLLQPRRDAPRLALGRRRTRPARLSEGRLGAPDVAARLGLPLSGRGAGPGRGRARLRGPAGPLRHPLLAGIQGPRRLPHADGVGRRRDPMAASRRRSRGCRWRRTICRSPSAGSRATRTRCSSTTGASSPSGSSASGARQGRHRVPRRRGRRDRLLPAARATSRSSAPSTLAAAGGHRRSAPESRRRRPLAGHGLSGKAEDGKIRLPHYGAWFGRLA